MSNPTIQMEFRPDILKVRSAIGLIKLGAALQRGMTKFAFLIEGESKRETPVDTGRLRASISTDIGNLYARIAPHVAYAGWIHEGKMTRSGREIHIRGGGRAGTPPGGKPYMRLGLEKATDKGEKEIIDQLNAEVNSSLDKI